MTLELSVGFPIMRPLSLVVFLLSSLLVKKRKLKSTSNARPNNGTQNETNPLGALKTQVKKLCKKMPMTRTPFPLPPPNTARHGNKSKSKHKIRNEATNVTLQYRTKRYG